MLSPIHPQAIYFRKTCGLHKAILFLLPENSLHSSFASLCTRSKRVPQPIHSLFVVTNELSNTTSSDATSKTEDQPSETSNAPQPETVDSTEAEAQNKAEDTTSNPTVDDSAANADSGDVKHPANEDERQEMARKGELPKDPNDHSGEPMKMHSGSEGQEGDDDSNDQAEGEKHDDSKDQGKRYFTVFNGS